MSDYAHRDRVMRAWFDGRTWDSNDEFLLKRRLLAANLPELAVFPLLIDDEWEVVSGETNHGRGDLLFTDGAGAFAVVEVKRFPALFGGKTSRTCRNKKRKAVREQAWTYARAVLRNLVDAQSVEVFVYTDDPFCAGLQRLGTLPRVVLEGEVGAQADPLAEDEDQAWEELEILAVDPVQPGFDLEVGGGVHEPAPALLAS